MTGRATAAGRWPSWVAGTGPVLAAMLLALLVRHPDAFTIPFLNDDFVFLDKVRDLGPLELWGFERLPFHWWRPWSRELHYWLWSRGGADPVVFHAVNLALAAVALTLFHALAARALGPARAALAAAGAAAMASWGLPLLWVAGVQDLWMLVASLATLLAWTRGRDRLALAGYALALMSKETAATLPVLLLAHERFVAGRRDAAVWRRLLPFAALALLWALAHPHLGGRALRGVTPEAAPPEARTLAPLGLLRHALALVNLDRLPAPAGETAPLAGAAVAALGLALWVARGARRAPAPPPAAAWGRFALVWAVLGWAPTLLPGLGWHAYYGLFGALGGWLAVAAWAPARPLAWAAAVAVVTLLGGLRADTVSTDWGDAYYQRRAGRMASELIALLRARVPDPAPGTRFWFAGLPDRIGFLQGDGPSLRVLYADPSLRGGYWGQWHPAPPGAAASGDRWFKLHPGPRLVEARLDPSDLGAPESASPEWAETLNGVGSQLLEQGAAGLALDAFAKLAVARPDDAEPAYNAAVAATALGDTAAAVRWFARAGARPVVSPRLRATAHEAGLDLWPEPSPRRP